MEGYFRVHPHSGESLHFRKLVSVGVQIGSSVREFSVEKVRILGDDGILMKLAGVDTPEAARELAGGEIWVDRANAAALAEDEFYVTDLIGCRVEHPKLGYLGTVCAVPAAGGGEVLELAGGPGGPLMIPFRKEYVHRVDLPQQSILLVEDVDVS